MKLEAVHADLNVFEGKVNWDRPIRLALLFEGGRAIRLNGGGDGSGMIADQLPLDGPVDLDDHGRVEVFDITDRLDPTLRGADVAEPRSIRDEDGRVIGLALPRAAAEPFCIWVEDDEFYWGTETRLKGDDGPLRNAALGERLKL